MLFCISNKTNIKSSSCVLEHHLMSDWFQNQSENHTPVDRLIHTESETQSWIDFAKVEHKFTYDDHVQWHLMDNQNVNFKWNACKANKPTYELSTHVTPVKFYWELSLFDCITSILCMQRKRNTVKIASLWLCFGCIIMQCACSVCSEIS